MSNQPNIRPGFTDDGFLDNRLSVLQPQKGYRAGIDAVTLAASACAKPGEHVLDLGAGVGVASLCLAERCQDVRVTGLETQADLVIISSENATRNKLSERVTFIEGSVAEKAAALATKKVAYGSFDHVITNPPFYEREKVWNSPDAGKATAHAFDELTLTEWLRVACAMAKPKGTVTIIHRADALPEMLQAVRGKLGGLTAFPLWPSERQPASRVLLQGIKGSRAPFTVAQGLVLHEADGSFKSQAMEILRDGAALSLTSA